MNIQTLEHFVAQENSFKELFKQNPLSLLNAKDRQEIADRIDSALSPENLHCDGEISRAEANRKYKYLTRVAQELLSVDPNVKFYEFS
jgi:hypothetical protein